MINVLSQTEEKHFNNERSLPAKKGDIVNVLERISNQEDQIKKNNFNTRLTDIVLKVNQKYVHNSNN